MQKASDQIFIGIVSGSIVLLMLGLFIFLFLLYYQRQHNSHIREKSSMRAVFEENLAQMEVEVQEQTRKNLAVDLHDNIGQLLSLTNFTLASIDLDQRTKAAAKLEDVQQLISRSIQELRRLSRVLQGEQLLEDGLIAAIRRDLDWLDEKGYYTIRFDAPADTATLDNREINLFVYRIFQESLTNILRHSGADTIHIILVCQPGAVMLKIGDNGHGFDPTLVADASGGIGLSNMKKRAELLGGNMHLAAGIGKGVLLTFNLPYKS